MEKWTGCGTVWYASLPFHTNFLPCAAEPEETDGRLERGWRIESTYITADAIKGNIYIYVFVYFFPPPLGFSPYTSEFKSAHRKHTRRIVQSFLFKDLIILMTANSKYVWCTLFLEISGRTMHNITRILPRCKCMQLLVTPTIHVFLVNN